MLLETNKIGNKIMQPSKNIGRDPEAYSEPCSTSMMALFAKIIHS